MNRQQRRAKQKNGTTTLDNADDIPLARPDTTKAERKTKTLLEIAGERQAQLNPGGPTFNSSTFKPENIVRVKIGEDGKVIPDPASNSQSDLEARTEPPWLDAVFLATTLSAIHFTLEVLVVHQYAQELRFPPIFSRTIFIAWPTWILIISVFHGLILPISAAKVSEKVQLWVVALRQAVYLLLANVAGCYLINLTNDRGYYAVMKNAPSVGTLWVWTVLELGIAGALAGVAGPALYAWWNGYGIF
jgi:hypothetical protein